MSNIKFDLYLILNMLQGLQKWNLDFFHFYGSSAFFQNQYTYFYILGSFPKYNEIKITGVFQLSLNPLPPKSRTVILISWFLVNFIE